MYRGPYYRLLEIIPGLTTWIIIIAPIILAIFSSYGAAFFAIFFSLYWLTKASIMGIYLISSFRHLKRNIQINWLERLKKLSEPKKLALYFQNQIQLTSGWRQKKLKEELDLLDKYIESKDQKDWRDILHVVLYTFVKEDIKILQSSIESVSKSNYDNKKIIILLAAEERAAPECFKTIRILKKEFSQYFADFLISIHPDNIIGELKGKGANADWALRKVLKPYLDKNNIDYANCLVSIFDADTRVHPQYFACLTYQYIINPNRRHRGYQPIPFYSNNIWDVPAINRLVAFGASFWQMIESTRSYRMVNFSSQSMSFQTLFDIDFVDRTIVSEDSRHYYRAFFRYDGDWRVVPLFTPVYMDAVLAVSFWKTLKNQYLQKRRWSWGIEHFPYVVAESFKNHQIPWVERFLIIWRLFEGNISLATVSILLIIMGILPFVFHPEFWQTVLGYNLPRIVRYLISLTWLGIIISIYISIALLPPRPKEKPPTKSFIMIIQWILIPISVLFFGSFPALESQTRLMLGKYLGFWVTEKKATNYKLNIR